MKQIFFFYILQTFIITQNNLIYIFYYLSSCINNSRNRKRGSIYSTLHVVPATYPLSKVISYYSRLPHFYKLENIDRERCGMVVGHPPNCSTGASVPCQLLLTACGYTFWTVRASEEPQLMEIAHVLQGSVSISENEEINLIN